MKRLQMLPEQLTFEGEFGAEINSFLPFVHWLWGTGELGRRKIVTYPGMAPFYCFLRSDQIIEATRPRCYVPPAARPHWLPTRDDHGPRDCSRESFPDYRSLFANDLFDTEKPVLMLHNKYCTEWGGPPVNFIPVELLAEALATLTDRFQIFYSRPGIAPGRNDYSADHQPDHDLQERSVLASFPETQIFEDLAADLSPTYTYNQLKLMLYAVTHFHVTTQGGNAHLAALFSGSTILIYHRAGRELSHSYRFGHFANAATPPPTLLIAQNPEEFSVALGALSKQAFSLAN